MSTEKNKAIYRRFVNEVLNAGNLAAIEELCAPDYINHDAPPGLPAGLAGVKQLIAGFRAAFPDLCYTIEDEIAEADKVVARGTWRGTHQGDLFGIPPTGKQVTVTRIDCTRITEGKMTEHWASQDLLGLMQQLGVAPAPEQA